jgi:putative phosphonate metabolism protein
LPDPRPPAHRYAIYYAAPPGSPLDRFGVTWLGRDHRTGERQKQPAVPGIDPERLGHLTASPRRYGFHGTLKAPFRLALGRRPGDLHAAARAFAQGHEAFTLPPLVIDDLKGFLAFVPAAPAPRLDALAAAAVEAFEPFRAPVSEAELARRLESPLSPRQREQLARYGYPYVLADFAFHMTLTERLGEAEKAVLLPHLQGRWRAFAAEPFVVDAIAVYEEPAPGADLVMTARYGFRDR